MAWTTKRPRLLRPTLHAALGTARRSIRAATAGGRLHGRTLVLARTAWLAVAALTLAFFITGSVLAAGRYSTVCHVASLACPPGEIPASILPALHDLHLSVQFIAAYNITIQVLFALVYGTVAALIFWRRSDDWLALFVALALLTFGAATAGDAVAILQDMLPDWWLPASAITFLGSAGLVLFVLVFPDGHFRPRWALWLGLLWLGFQFPAYFLARSLLSWRNWPYVVALAAWTTFLGAMVAAQVHRYRRMSTPVQRQQTKWVVYGIAVALLGFLASNLWLLIVGPDPRSAGQVLAELVAGVLASLFLLLIPVCIGIAILHHHLFDIDIIIRRTLVYSILTATLATIYALAQIVLQAGFYAVTGQGSALAVVGSTLAIGALFQPVRSRVQADVDRRFYRRKYDAARTVQAFGAIVRDEVDLAHLSEQLVMVVEQTMQPSQVSLWLVHRPTGQGGEAGAPGVGQRPSYAAEVEAARVPKPVPLPGLFAVPEGSTSK